MNNIGKLDVLQKMQNIASTAIQSIVRDQWLQSFERNIRYRKGEQFLNEDMLNFLKDIEATPYTANKCDPVINKYLSLISNSLKKVGFSPNTNSKYDKIQSEVLKHWAMNVQTQNDHQDMAQLKIEDMLVGGIGWSQFYFESGKYYYEYIDPRFVFWDPYDLSPRLNNQSHIVLVRYLTLDELTLSYPKHAYYLKELKSKSSIDITENSYDFYSSNIGQDIKNGVWRYGNTVRVIEVYYKENAKYYEVAGYKKESDNNLMLNDSEEDIQDQIVFSTFDKEFALQKLDSTEIIEKQGTKIYKGVYIDDYLLDHGEIPEQTPNQRHFPVVPTVYKRDFAGAPYGVLDTLLPYQDAYNICLTGYMHFKNARIIIGNAPNVGNTDKFGDAIAKTLRSKSGYISIPESQHIQIIEHGKAVGFDIQMLDKIDKMWEDATGLHNEFSGQILRETSGAAIQALTQNTYNNIHKNSILNAYERMLISEGQLMFDTLRGTKNIKQLVKYYKLGQDENVQLNDDIALLNLEIFIDSAPNYASSALEEKAIINNILSTPNPNLFMFNQYILTNLGLSDKTAFELVQSWEYASVRQQQIQGRAQLELQKEQMEMQMQMQNQQTGGNNEK